MTRTVTHFFIIAAVVFCSLPGMYMPGLAQDSPAAPHESLQEPLIDLDFTNVDIREVLRAIGMLQGVNVVADPDVSGPVTIRLEQVTAEEGLRLLASSYGWVVERQDGSFRLRQGIDSAPLRVEKIGEGVNVVANGASVDSILVTIARHTGLSLAISREVTEITTQPMTIYLHRLPPLQALDIVAHATGLHVRQEKETLFIEPPGAVHSHRILGDDTSLSVGRTLPPGFGRLDLADGLLDVEIRDVSIGTFLKELADRFGPDDGLMPIFADRNVSGTEITGAAFQLPFKEALTGLLAPYGLEIVEAGGGLRIARQTPPVPYTLSYVDGLLSVRAQAASLNELLRDVASLTSVTLLIPSGMAHRVSTDLQPMPPQEAVRLLLDEAGYELEQVDEIAGDDRWRGVWRVVPPDTRPVRVDVQGTLLSVEASDARLSTILREISKESGNNIVLGSGPDPSMTITLRDLPLPDLLEAILERDKGRVEQKESYFLVQMPDPEPARPASASIRQQAMAQGISVLEVDEGVISLAFNDVPVHILFAAVAEAGGPELTADRAILNDRVSGVVRGAVDEALNSYLIQEGYRILPLMQGVLVYSGRTNEPIIYYEPDVDGQGLFYLDVSGVELSTVLRDMAHKAGRNVIIYSHVRANLNHVRLYGISFEEGLQNLLKGTTFAVVERNGTYLVGEGVTPRFDSRELFKSKVVHLDHISAQHLINILPPSLPSQNVRPLPDGWGLVITGHQELIEAMEAFVATVDRPTQVKPVVLTLRHADGSEIAPVVARQFPPEVFQYLEAQNAFLLQGTADVNQRIQTYIEALDQPEMATKTVVYPMKHLMAEDAKAHLPPHFDSSRVMVIPDQNALVITGREETIKSITDYLTGIDVRNPQIRFDVMIVEITDRQRAQFGLSGAAGDGTLKFDLLGGAPMTLNLGPSSSGGALVSTLSTLIQEGRANLLANPRITTLSGREASFNVLTTSRFWSPQTNVDPDDPDSGSNVVPVFRTIETGIRLRLLPWISASGEITIELSPEISDSDRSSGGSSLPSTNDRSVQTTVRVRDGETFVIGGLIQRSEQVDVSKVPVLGDLPIFGRLFRSENRSEIETEFVIAITSHLVDFPNEDHLLQEP